MIFALVAWALALAGSPAPIAGQGQATPLVVVPDRTGGYRPLLRIGPVLADSAFEAAVRSGMPIRLHLNVELWHDGFFDSLEGSRRLTTVVLYQPLEERFVVRTQASPAKSRRFSTFEAARAAVEGVYALPIRPVRSGRYYYTATLELETLSLSDLEELERWLEGELEPAVSGEGSVPGA
ncbi:MAG TPA: DUF4390 domain-containing protein, partial [Longimicrobiales bacterium]